jgi:serine/threonine protein kinase
MGSADRSSVRPTGDVDEVTVGTVVAGKYRLDARLGSGGMGTVWACTHLGLGDRMAIKIVSTSTALSREVRSRFAKEARATARLKSRFSVQVFDSGELPHGTPYIVMEYLEGETLSQHLRSVSKMPIDETIGILVQVARGLQRAHAEGIVHRDIKPGNIFLAHTSDDGIVAKVFDFGVVKLLDAANGTETVEGMFVGTPQFMSPEQAMGRTDVDHRTDIYSLGVLAYRMLTGRPVYEVASIPALVLQICNGPLPKLRDVLPDLPPDVESWFQRTCARDPNLRFDSAVECIEDLLRAAGMSASRLLVSDTLTSSISGLRTYRSGTIRAQGSQYVSAMAPSPLASTATEKSFLAAVRRGPRWVAPALVACVLCTLAAAVTFLRAPEHGGNGYVPTAARAVESGPALALPVVSAAASSVTAVDASPQGSVSAPARAPAVHRSTPAAVIVRPAASAPAAPERPVLGAPAAPTFQNPRGANGAINDVGY